jgi:AcrR family transcriptional regulator
MSQSKNPTTKEKILIAAIRIFAREGYKGATVRAICKEAGTANATAVNYYYGGKAKLYRTILDMIFAENTRRRKEREAAWQKEEQSDRELSAEERMRRYLEIMIDVGFADDPLHKDVVAILLREMMSPSQYLDEIVEHHTRPDNKEATEITRALLGPDAPDYVVRDCLTSVGGQIFYYMAFWPIFSRVYPEHPGIPNYKDTLLEHIMRFSLAGLEATRNALANGEIPPEQPT